MLHRRAILQGLGAAAALTPAAGLAAAPATQRKIWRVGGKRVRTVDIHAHVAPDMTDVLAGTPFQARDRSADKRMAVDAVRLARMDRQGIDVEVLSANPYWYDMDRELSARFIDRLNGRVADLTRTYPGRFYALACVAMQHPDLAAAQLEDAMKTRGLRGASLGCTVNGEELASPRFDPFWKKCQDLNATVFLHPQDSALVTGIAKRTTGGGSLANVIGNPLETTIALSHLIFQGTFDRFPELRIAAAHGGGYLPSYVDRSDHGCLANPDTCPPSDPPPKKKPSEYMKRLYVDALVFTPEATRHLAAVVGPRRMMIGTDYPFPWVDDPIETVMTTPGLSDADKVAILGGTASRLFNIPA
ncbi:MAG TPA: amidohydrolase family protein [Caulobacteraceae bacterium]|nr:amidohydrolase family protein [Caulobacteraceae bacterium]